MDSRFFPGHAAFAVFLLLYLYGCGETVEEAERGEEAQKPENQKPISKVVDDFDGLGRVREYKSFRGETVKSWEGYGIYFEEAEVDLRRIPVAANDLALEVQFDLFNWGNWLSIRRELGVVVDLSGYDGLELEVQAEQVQNAQLRITLSDVESQDDAQVHGADEMWWFEAPEEFLSQQGKSVILKAPFDEFDLAEGAGTRYNDGRLDLSKIVAYEINLISTGRASGAGTLRLNSLQTYRE